MERSDMETKTKNDKLLALAVDISLNYGDALLKRKEQDKAIALFKECLRISQELGRPKLTTTCFGRLGGAHLKSCDFLNAIACYERVLQGLVESDAEGKSVLVLLKTLADLNRSVCDFAKADVYMTNHSVLAKKLGIEVNDSDRTPRMNYVGQSAGECLNSIDKAERMLETAKATKDEQMEANAYNLMAFNYRLLREFEKSITSCNKHLELCEKIGDFHGQSQAYGNLGSCYRHLGEIKKAMEYFEKELKICDETGDKLVKCHAYNNLGLCYMDVGDHKKAVSYFKYLLDVTLAAGRKKEAGGAYSNLSCAYFKLKEPRKALSYSEKHLQLAKEMGISNFAYCYGLNFLRQ